MRIGLIGNCQVQTYAALLKRMDTEVAIDVMDYSDPSSRVEDNRKQFLDKIKDMDYVLCQDTAMSFTNYKDIASAYGTGKLVRICNFFFRGTYPDICYVGTFERRMGFNSLNSVVILGSFLKDLSIEDCMQQFNAETFEKLGLHKAWTDSLTNLKARDVNLDFPGAALVEKLVRLYPIFRTYNHPTATFLAEYIADILKRLGMKFQMLRSTPMDDPLHFIELPIYDFVASGNDLRYRTPQYLRIYNTFYDLESFIRLNYNAYAQWQKSELSINSPADLKQEIAQHDPSWLTPPGSNISER